MPLSDAEIALKWEDEAQLLSFTAADRVQTTAQTWNGYISALLGVVGLAGVTFVPSSVDKVAGPLPSPGPGAGGGGHPAGVAGVGVLGPGRWRVHEDHLDGRHCVPAGCEAEG